MKTSTLVSAIVIVVVIIAVGAYLWQKSLLQLPIINNPQQTQANDEADVRALVENFGETLKNVSLLSPSAATDIQNNYKSYVDASLLSSWESNPSTAPGKLVSSPWPDHIEIDSVQMQSTNSYLVTGKIIEVTSEEELNGGAAATRDITLSVDRIGTNWLITSLTMQSESATSGGGQAGQETATNGGVTFKYPTSLGTTYIATQTWPPQMQLINSNFSCSNSSGSGSATTPAISQKVVNGRIYCTQISSEGAAGSIYETFVYTTPKNGKLLQMTFVLRYPQCANYETDQSTACTDEQKSFDLDSIVDGIVQTATWDTSSDNNTAIKLGQCLSKSDTASKATCDALISQITDFQSCIMAGFTVTSDTPPACSTPDGRKFSQK